ncbi:MAG: hypothetical protein ACRELE_05215, partial [Gemmatimonadales bacterium]
ASLQSIERACARIAAEVLIVRPRGRPPLRESQAVTLREVSVDDVTLVPVRWGVGVVAARAPVFGCLTTEFTVHADWATASLAALAGGAAGAAGAIELAPNTGMTAAAVYLVRFGAYLPRIGGTLRSTEQIPGDTAAYRRRDVVAFPDLLATGFWEIEFHTRFLAQGRHLLAIPKALAVFRSTRSLSASLVLRFRHGTEFGAVRVVQKHHGRWRLMLAAPIVPSVLLARIVRRAAGAPGGGRLLVRSLPVVVLLCAAWATGEACGAWSAGSSRR